MPASIFTICRHGWHCISGQYQPRCQEMFIAKTHHVIHFPNVSHAAVHSIQLPLPCRCWECGNNRRMRTLDCHNIDIPALNARCINSSMLCAGRRFSYLHLSSRPFTQAHVPKIQSHTRLRTISKRRWTHAPSKTIRGADHNLATAIRRCSYRTRLLLQGTI